MYHINQPEVAQGGWRVKGMTVWVAGPLAYHQGVRLAWHPRWIHRKVESQRQRMGYGPNASASKRGRANHSTNQWMGCRGYRRVLGDRVSLTHVAQTWQPHRRSDQR